MSRSALTVRSSRSWLTHKVLLVLTLMLILLLVCGCEIIEAPAAPEDPPIEQPGDPGDPGDPDPPSRGGPAVVLGADYALPDWVAPEDFSGYVDHPDAGDPDLGPSYRNLWVHWADLEPARGHYDFSIIDRALGEAESGGYRLSLQIMSVVCGGSDDIPSSVPAWIFDEFDLTEDDCVNLGGNWQLRVIPAWREDIRTAFNDMIRAFGAAGYPQRESLGASYIHGISQSRGEEFVLEPYQVTRLENEAGFSAQVMGEWIRSRMDAYAEAFGARMQKVAWVGKMGIWHYSGQDYADTAWDLVQYAWSLGAGSRGGIVELYHVALDEPALGQSVDADGYLHTDETIPPLAEGLYFGDENEEYGDDWTWRYGDVAGETERYRLAIFRALQMQVRFLWTGASAEAVDSPLSRYARLGLGKTVENSPDAWACLKESAVGVWITPAVRVKNFERWLYQRDVSGAMTVPTERFDRDFNAGSIGDTDEGAFYDDLARRTDVANEQPAMCFDLDDRFTTTGDVEVKVEIRDDNRASWHLEHADAAGSLVSTPSFTGEGDGAIRTVTFTLDDFRFANDLEHGMDLRIVCDGSEDVTVRWMRVVRLTRP